MKITYEKILGFVIIGWLLFVVAAISSHDTYHSKMILEQDGFTNVKMTGYNFLSCGKEDWFRDGFSAMKNGKNIQGTVCSNIFKESTIRFK